jgi:hypothetical protein
MSEEKFLSDEAIKKFKKWKEEAKRDMRWAETNAEFIKELAEVCSQLRMVIDAYSDYAGPYAQPFIAAQLEGILGVYRKKETEQC